MSDEKSMKDKFKVLVPKNLLKYLEMAGTMIYTEGNRYFYLPYWFKCDGDNYEEFPLGSQPEELNDYLTNQREFKEKDYDFRQHFMEGFKHITPTKEEQKKLLSFFEPQEKTSPNNLVSKGEGITIRELKEYVKDLPEVDDEGEDYKLWISTSEFGSRPACSITQLNKGDRIVESVKFKE